MTGSFLKNLLGELSLDRALLQIIDKPYIKDLATRLKQNEAVQEIFNRLDKEEGIMGWMDYEQMLDMRERILPEMLIKESGLETPKPTIEGKIGSSFDEQFENILGKKKFAAGGGFKPKIKGSFIKNIMSGLLDQAAERMGMSEYPRLDLDNPKMFSRSILDWIQQQLGDELFLEPKIKDSFDSNMLGLDNIDAVMEQGQKNLYPNIMEDSQKRFDKAQLWADKDVKSRTPEGYKEEIYGDIVDDTKLINVVESSFKNLSDFKDLLDAVESAIKFKATLESNPYKPKPKTRHARGGIAALEEGGPYGDVWKYINVNEGPNKGPVSWDDLSEEQKESWKKEIKKRHTEPHYADTPAWDVLGFTAEPEYIARPYVRYWNPETKTYQKSPVTKEQYENEAWLDRQRRASGPVTPYKFDPLKFGKLLGLDELAWYKGIGQSATPGTSGVAGFYGAAMNPMEDYHENWEDYAAETGHYIPQWQQMPAAMGLGIGGFELLKRAIVNKLPPGAQSVIKEMFPLSMDKAFGKGSLKNWKKSLWRNPKNILKMHVNPKFNKQLLQQGISKFTPRLAAKFGAGSLGGPIGLSIAAGLTGYDIYKLIQWYKDNMAHVEDAKGSKYDPEGLGISKSELIEEFWKEAIPANE